MKYTKTAQDKTRIKNDLENHKLMLILKDIKKCKFNVGDVLIKQRLVYSESPHANSEPEWVTCNVSSVNRAPVKYLYAFENELGVGYLKRLKPDGSGPDDKAICIINYDISKIRFMLDPDYADHMLIGDGDFNYNAKYIESKNFREEAIKKNIELRIKGKDSIELWFEKVKKGDTVWISNGTSDTDDSEHLVINKKKELSNFFGDDGGSYIEVIQIAKNAKTRSYIIYKDNIGNNCYVFSQKPHSLTDPLCGHQK